MNLFVAKSRLKSAKVGYCRFVSLAVASVALMTIAGCQTKALTSACDILVPIAPLPATNAYLVKQDRKTAEQIAKHRGRYQQYRCG